MHEKIEELVKSSGRDGLTDVSLEALSITQEMFDKIDTIHTGNMISTEGLVDTVKKMLGMSNKGKHDAGFKRHNLYGNSFALQGLRHGYANKAWMDKQTFVKGEVNASGITDMIDKSKPVEPESLIAQCEQFLKDFPAWTRDVNEYAKKTGEIRREAIKKGVSPETVQFINAELKKLKKPTYKGTTKKPSGHNEDKVMALDESKALEAGKGILKLLERLQKEYSADRINIEFEGSGGSMTDEMLADKAFRNAMVHGDMNPQEVHAKDPGFESAREVFFDQIMAVALWIDRSIKGDAHFD